MAPPLRLSRSSGTSKPLNCVKASGDLPPDVSIDPLSTGLMAALQGGYPLAQPRGSSPRWPPRSMWRLRTSRARLNVELIAKQPRIRAEVASCLWNHPPPASPRSLASPVVGRDSALSSRTASGRVRARPGPRRPTRRWSINRRTWASLRPGPVSGAPRAGVRCADERGRRPAQGRVRSA
jgi:hypothetical protein